jgi:ribosomal protein RSM22 (predicted rRNA methylase)
LALTRAVPEADLRRASRRLTETYRSVSLPAGMQTLAERAAYLAVRLPATYAAVRSTLLETALRIREFQPISLLDLGSGPGTALWAAAEIFPSLRDCWAIERDAGLARIGKALAEQHEMIRNASWVINDIRTWRTDKKFDLVIASYSLGELEKADRRTFLNQAWESCQGVLVLVEPGTQKGFGVIAEARDQLIALEAKLAAPCPHSLECPMRASGDWCHFSERVQRTSEHRRLKQAELGYEDEKFSYMVTSHLPVEQASARVVRHPLRHSGHTKLQLCTPEGLRQRTVTRSEGELYRRVKRVEWGSGWEE